MSAEQIRNLKIKTGAVKRTTKEYLYYFKEAEREQKKLQEMKDSKSDPYDIKQQENVAQESTMMIPETKKSLEHVLQDLTTFLADGTADVAGDELYMKAKTDADEAVTGAKEALETASG